METTGSNRWQGRQAGRSGTHWFHRQPQASARRLDEPWDSPYHRDLLERRIRVVPVGSSPYGTVPLLHTIYVRPAGQGLLLDPEIGELSRADITDPPEATIMLVPLAPEHAIHFFKPGDPSLPEAHQAAAGKQAMQKLQWANGRARVLMADGRTRSISADISWRDFHALCTISGGDDLRRLFPSH